MAQRGMIKKYQELRLLLNLSYLLSSNTLRGGGGGGWLEGSRFSFTDIIFPAG